CADDSVPFAHAKVGYRQAIFKQKSPGSKERRAFLFLAGVAIALLCATAARAEALYRLPWPEGLSFMFTQVSDGRITSHFTKATRDAVDIAMPEGVPVLAARAGVVAAMAAHFGGAAGEEALSYEGNFVRVRHADGTAAIYAHLKHEGVVVNLGDSVTEGELLGYSGATGDVSEPHLHFVVVRALTNSSGWREESSVPVTFYIGVPPVAFAPRAALRVKANYSSAAQAPRTPSEGEPLVPWKPTALGPAEEAAAWCLLAAWLASAIAGFAWFWKFSKE
ncbi:MAG TPA: peptidoglycan DD-metalloendopeptidase family protein, partial [Gemmatimonadales bacterium]|nr:peptidoglycan DD-metalloendopeptidase family protein [Gemmatimonadales bacterium]